MYLNATYVVRYGTVPISLSPEIYSLISYARLVLGAISPLMFSALTPHLEEGEDHVFVYGIKAEVVTTFLSWVYKGGSYQVGQIPECLKCIPTYIFT